MKTNDSAPSTLLHDLQALVVEAEKLIGDSASEAGSEAVSALRARLEAAQERVSAACALAKQKVVAGAHRTDEAIHANPYTAIAIATGVGVLLGVLLGRRSK